MKKKFLFMTILTFLLCLIGFTSKSLATFEIEDFTINSVLYENGDLEVEEYITYNTTETKNGVIRYIEFKNPSNNLNSASGVELKAVSVDGIEYVEVPSATNGQSGKYEKKLTSKGMDLKVYSPMRRGSYTVVYKYLLKDVAVKYNDTSELFWNFIGNGWDTDINNLKINISLPNTAKKEKIYVFGHGADNGRFEKSENRITLTAYNLEPKQAIDARILFSKNAIPECTKIKNSNVLQKYINQEEGMSKEKEPQVILGLNIKEIAIYTSIIFVLIGIVLYFKYDKEIYVKKQYYCREIPDNLEIEDIQYIYNRRKPKNALWITFLNLIKKGVFTVKKTQNEVGKEVIEIIDNKKDIKLKEYQEFFKNYIIKRMKDGKITDLKLKACMKNPRDFKYSKYTDALEKETEVLLDEVQKPPKGAYTFLVTLMILLIGIIIFMSIQSKAPDMTFGIAMFLIMTTFIYTIFFKSIKFTIVTILFFVMHFGAFQTANISMLISTGLGWMYIPYIVLFFMLQYAYRIKKVSKEERVIIEKAKGLKRYISHYSLLKEKEASAIVLWEDYLLLAIALGVNKRVVNNLYKELENNNLSFVDYAILDISLRTAFESSIRTGNIGSSTSGSGSSYSGSSGGFSGGSSSGGGGRWLWTEVHHSKNIEKKVR